MPMNAWWETIQKLFQEPAPLVQLEKELQKEPRAQKPDLIQKLLRTLCLQKQKFPAHFFQNYPVFIKALEEITKQTLFDKTIIYHSSWEIFEKATIRHGEVHCVPVYSSADSIVNFGSESLCEYGIGYSILDAGYHYLKLKSTTNGEPLVVESIDSPANKSLLETELSNQAFVLSNSALIAHADSELANYYFTLANSFLDKAQPGSLETALKACLHLTSSDRAEDPYMALKTTVTQNYFADDTGTSHPLPAIIFSQLQSSHQNPESTFIFLRNEKQKQNNTMGPS